MKVKNFLINSNIRKNFNEKINKDYLFYWEKMNLGFDHLVVWSAVIEIFLGRIIPNLSWFWFPEPFLWVSF